MRKNQLASFLLVLGITLSPILQAQSLKVAFAHWPPWKISTSTTIDGIDARIMRSLAERSGIDVEFVQCPWTRCIAFIKDGHADLITSFGKTEERQAFTHYLGDPYFVDSISFWVPRISGKNIREHADLIDLRIGTTAGSTYFPRFDQDTNLNKVRVDFEEQMFKMLDADRIDAFIGFESSMRYQLAGKQLLEQFKQVEYFVPSSEYYVGMSKKSPRIALRKTITKELAAMREEGEIERIIGRFIEETATENPR